MSVVLPADWPAPPGVQAFTTLRHGAGTSLPPFDQFNLGNRVAANGDDAATVERNRTELVQRLALPSTPHWLRQVHGTEVLQCTAAGSAMPAASEPLADAAVTSTPGVVLAILTADCLPVLFAEVGGPALGAAHAGWRGLAAGVLENTVAAMAAPAGDVIAWLGPAAGPQAYEVGEEVFQAFIARDAAAAAAFAPTRPGHWHVDLYALARQRLVAIGVTRVYGGKLCTISEPKRFYSHRRDARTGRMASVIWRTD